MKNHNITQNPASQASGRAILRQVLFGNSVTGDDNMIAPAAASTPAHPPFITKEPLIYSGGVPVAQGCALKRIQGLNYSELPEKYRVVTLLFPDVSTYFH